MKRRKTERLVLGILVIGGLLGVRSALPQQACTETTDTFTEHFAGVDNIDAGQSSAKFWYNDPATPRTVVTMNKQGANFSVSSPTTIPGWINTCAAGDFDLDGWTDYIGSSSDISNALAFVRNMGGQGQVGTFRITHWIDGCTGDSGGNPTHGVGGSSLDTTSRHAGMTAGDYDGDGDVDFLFMVTDTTSPYPWRRIWLYKNNFISGGVRTGILSFTKTDLASAWSAVKGFAWSATFMTSLDFDHDGDIDIIYGDYAGEVLKITNTGNGAINAQTFIVNTTPLFTTGWGQRGVSTVSVADFDNDGDLDIFVGSVSYGSMLYYKNDGTGQFTLFATYTDPNQNPTNDLYDGAATVSLAADFDGDGDIDLVVGTDNWNYGTDYGGKVFYFRNNGNDTFTQNIKFNGQTRNPQVYDFDLGFSFDYNNDGLLDFLIADGNHTEDYYLFVNQLAAVYNTSGVAVSTNLTSTLSVQYAITRVRFTVIDQSVYGSSSGLSLTYYVSNDDGQTWESYAQYTGSGISNRTNQPWHDFHSYGARLRWKAAFSAPNDSVPGFSDASYDTPAVDQIRLEYVYVEKREYSRTSDAATTVSIGGETRKLIIAATFIFPGLDGHLRAYDVTDMHARNIAYSSLQSVTMADSGSSSGRQLTQGVEIVWDAGELLRDRTADNRSVYATMRTTDYWGNVTWSRRTFSRSYVSTFASLLSDPDGDNSGLIDFIRGTGQPWKLADIQHSNPVVVGPPDGIPALMGTGYSTFAATWANRTKVVFAGANDGMLHCFDATTGVELWGYIPYNLLPKLKNLSQKDPITGQRYRVGGVFVDGTPAVADVYINSAWKTVLICGQGPGYGSSVGGGLNYYFALDVTDPTNPQPLWEFTATTVGETWSVPAIGKIRDGSNTRWVAFMGSGYDNDTSNTCGNRFYTVRIDTGAALSTKTASNVNTGSGIPWPYTDIYVAIPGSPTLADTNNDGYTEKVYVGDLDGRLWRLNTSDSNVSNWTFTAIYTDRLYYPIITKPAVYLDPVNLSAPPFVFFGTGGDDRAPNDRNYAFLALMDDSTPHIEWYLGNPSDLGLSASKAMGAFDLGEKAWADPVISDNTVYLSALKGSIENVNPCLNLSEIGKFYARYIATEAGGAMGTSALKGPGTSRLASLQLTSKARKAVTLGERRQMGQSTKRDVYIQEYDSTMERLEQPGGRFVLIIKSWREIFQIIR